MRNSRDEVRELFSDPSWVHPANVDFLRGEVTRSPQPTLLARFLFRYAERNGLPHDRQQLLALVTLAGQSPFLGDLLLRNPDYLRWGMGEAGGAGNQTSEDLREDLARFRYTLSTLPDAALLRRFKNRQYLRIALRDLLGKVDLADTTRHLSLLADTLLQEAYLLARQTVLNRHGAPQFVDEQGRLTEASFAILSLGKLGGNELNYSSDIDLIYLFSREGQTAGVDGDPQSVISNREFFTWVAEGITDRIASVSAEGQVYRVDLRLRPGGRDGELVHSLRSALAYYRTWARTWERQALLKARYSAGDTSLVHAFLKGAEESVYPVGAAPFLALEIKEMKDRIDEELGRSGRNETDIKLGRGGLRELEFAVQALQLTHGGREPWVRDGNTLRALHRLADKGLVSYGQHSSLSRAYLFLRRVEHRLQLERNRQTYSIPLPPEELQALARRLGYTQIPEEGGSFLRDLEHHRAAVRTFYDSVFGRVAQVSLEEMGKDPLLDAVPESELRALLGGTGTARPEEALQHLHRIRNLLSAERFPPDGRRAVRRTSAAILREATSLVDSERALSNLERFLSSLPVDPEASLSFFAQVEWIPPLVRLFGKSQYLSQILIRRPEILTELGTVADCFRGRTPSEMISALGDRLDLTREVREAAGALRQFQHVQVLLVGLRDVHGQDSLGKTLRNLTVLAEICLSGGERAARRFSGDNADSARFCVLGLGRLGYRELDYNSDLDLIFVTDALGDCAHLETVRRRAETLVHLLTAVTQEGSLYSVDLRLRPAGGEGELVQTRKGLVAYFRESAKIWEKMAFLKARPVAGDLDLGEEVVQTIREGIFERAGADGLAAEVKGMKERLEGAPGAGGADRICLKSGAGGILDVHFLIEYLQIRNRLSGPPDRDTLQMLNLLYSRGLILVADYTHLYGGYQLLRSLDHSMRLLYDRSGESLSTSAAVLSRLAHEINLALQPDESFDGGHLLLRLEAARQGIRKSFLRLVR